MEASLTSKTSNDNKLLSKYHSSTNYNTFIHLRAKFNQKGHIKIHNIFPQTRNNFKSFESSHNNNHRNTSESFQDSIKVVNYSSKSKKTTNNNNKVNIMKSKYFPILYNKYLHNKFNSNIEYKKSLSSDFKKNNKLIINKLSTKYKQNNSFNRKDMNNYYYIKGTKFIKYQISPYKIDNYYKFLQNNFYKVVLERRKEIVMNAILKAYQKKNGINQSKDEKSFNQKVNDIINKEFLIVKNNMEKK